MGDKLYEENSVQAIAESIRSKLGVDTTYKIAEMSGAINTIVVPDGTTNITENGYHDVKAYEQAYVHVEGGITPTGTTNIYENGDHDVTDYATAHVAVPQPIGKKTVTENGTDIDIAQYATLDVSVQPNVGTKTINQNGVYNASSDGLDGYSKVTVNTPVPTGKKTIAANGTDIDVSSYALVDVSVPGPVGKKTITENGTDIDIAAYATADVQVPGPDLGTKTITENGTYPASADNLDGYSSVTVNTPVPSGTLDIDENGTYNVSQYAYADVAVPGIVPSGTYSVTENGTYDITNYANVSVNVSGGGGGLPSNMQIVDVSITEDVVTITVPYDNTRSVAMLFVIPNMIQEVAYEMTFMMAKRDFYTKEAELNQTYGTAFNYKYTFEQPYTGSNIGSVTVDSTNATITINGKGGKYVFKNGDSFHVIIVYGIIE